MQELTGKAADLDVTRLDKRIDRMMPELGFSPDDNDRLVASYRRALSHFASCSGCLLQRLAYGCLPECDLPASASIHMLSSIWPSFP
jgi:hypothetical protein